MLSQEDLPESLVVPCLEILRILTPSEKELIRIVVEIVVELRDATDEEELPVRLLHVFLPLHLRLFCHQLIANHWV